MKVAVLTTFDDLDRSYSLVGVALEQCAMLREHEVDFDLFVLEPMDDNHARKREPQFSEQAWLRPNIRPEVPRGKLEEDVINEDVRVRTIQWLRKILPDYDVAIAHDWMFLTWNVSYNAAVREVVEEFPGTTWIHWVHSAPGVRPNRLLGPGSLRYKPCQYSLYAYLNEEDRLRYAESIGTDLGVVRTVYNPMDAATYLQADDDLARFIRKYRLDHHDLMQVYPFSMPRAVSKGIDKIIGIFGEWKRMGYRVKLVMVNAHTNHPREQQQVQSFSEMAWRDWRLSPEDLIWTSTQEGWEYSVPNPSIRKLFLLSNIFIFPTHSEACSRVLQEASLAGCLVVGNENFRPMYEFLHPSVRRWTFGSERETVTYNTGVNQWLSEVARALSPLLNHPILKQKTHMMNLCSRETIWREQFGPLIEEASRMSKARRAA